jgi:transcriptional repressor NrdR
MKRSGATEPFSRDKIVAGVRKACQGRPVNEDDLALLAQRVEETLRSSGTAELDAYEIGLAILGPLRELDEVAYLRFASVYQAFDSLEDFEAAITSLRVDRDRREGRSDEVPDDEVPDAEAEADGEPADATADALGAEDARVRTGQLPAES